MNDGLTVLLSGFLRGNYRSGQYLRPPTFQLLFQIGGRLYDVIATEYSKFYLHLPRGAFHF